MALTEKVVCDVCGIVKGDANHWLMFECVEFPPSRLGDAEEEFTGVQVGPWSANIYRGYGHLCGESCASKLLSKAIAEWYPKAIEEMVDERAKWILRSYGLRDLCRS